jgi:hypothetical protein
VVPAARVVQAVPAERPVPEAQAARAEPVTLTVPVAPEVPEE